mgnify:CR=1 FL=1
MKQWYYSEANEQRGPVSEAELKQLLESRVIPPASLVWSENMSGWVAANSLDILLRDLSIGPALRAAEHTRLRAIMGHTENREALRWELVRALRDGSMALDTPGLVDHLRATVAGELAIDQPSYSGFKTALHNGVA